MAELAKLPKDMVFFTQITMESAEDPEYLDAMRRANIKGALVGVEAVTPEGLKAVYKDFKLLRRQAGPAVTDVPQTRRSCAGLIHLRPADGQTKHVWSHGGIGDEGAGDICPVCDDDAISWNGQETSTGGKKS